MKLGGSQLCLSLCRSFFLPFYRLVARFRVSTVRVGILDKQETLQRSSLLPLSLTLDWEGCGMRSTPFPDVQGPADLGPADSQVSSSDICSQGSAGADSLQRVMWLAPSAWSGLCPPASLSSETQAAKLPNIDTPKVLQCWGMKPCMTCLKSG